MINTTLLDQPHDDDYLWRYFRCFDHLKYFLEGYVRLSSLRSFDDYLESIVPEHYYLIQYLNNTSILGYRKETRDIDKSTSKALDSFERLNENLDNIREIINMGLIMENLNKVWGIKEKKDFIKMFHEKVDTLPDMYANHEEYQKRVYTSCWLINNTFDEDYLMWKSYSEPGGFAIRIKYKYIKDLLEKSLERYEENNLFTNESIVNTFTTGKVRYHHFLTSNDWTEQVKNGIPLSYFKHSSYKHENEFRICVEFNNSASVSDRFYFGGLYLLHCEVILHPSSFFGEYKKYAKIFKENGINHMPIFSSLNCRNS